MSTTDYTYDNETEVRLILAAGEIPVGSTVTKVKGQKPYVIKNEVVIYNPGEAKTVIPAADGVRFLFDEQGNINAINAQVDLVWMASARQAFEWLGRALEETPQ
jgi:hypothetical protein